MRRTERPDTFTYLHPPDESEYKMLLGSFMTIVNAFFPFLTSV